jgi:hypothetical protein
MEQNKNFLKVGEKVVFKPKTEGLDYALESGKVYTADIDRYTDEISFNMAPDITLPEKLYTTDEDNKFVNKVVDRYNITKEGTVGVMLSGLKGSGKTIMMKRIALESKLPILLIDKSFYPKDLISLFNKLADTQICILMDEVDKLGERYDDDYLLKVLDGINSSGKKLMIFTCNDDEDVNEYLKDRCSRIRYWRDYGEMPASMIQAVLEDKLDDKTEIKPLTDFIQEKFACASFDNIASFADEVNACPNDTYEDLFNDMNLSEK